MWMWCRWHGIGQVQTHRLNNKTQVAKERTVSIGQNNAATSLRRRYPTSLWSFYIVAMETSDGVGKTTSLQRLNMTSLNETLQNVLRHFHQSNMAMSERRSTATSQQHFNDVIVSTGISSLHYQSTLFQVCM